MSDRQRELAARREALLAQAAIQREAIGHSVQDIETRLAGIDRGIEIARRIVKKPIVLAGGIALVTLVGPRRLLRIAGRSAVLFASGRRVMRMLGNR
jgi:hypothetical protein